MIRLKRVALSLLLLLLLLLLLMLFFTIEFSLGGSSSYITTDKTKINIHKPNNTKHNTNNT